MLFWSLESPHFLKVFIHPPVSWVFCNVVMALTFVPSAQNLTIRVHVFRANSSFSYSKLKTILL